jgi:tRNA modification GTPase
LLALLNAEDVQEVTWQELAQDRFADPVAAALLPFARTRRTAAILLGQANGAYARAVAAIEAEGVDASALREMLQRNAVVGWHLVEPWTVAIVGKPNAGKSTLLNALAGFDRSIVSPIAGTTRDAVSVSLAFDGWPVDVIDTAGLRESGDALEEEGVSRAKDALAASDLSLWIADATEVQLLPLEEWMPIQTSGRVLVVLNKRDLLARPIDGIAGAISISAATGDGIPQLVTRMTELLVPYPPAPGEPVPYSPELSRRWS